MRWFKHISNSRNDTFVRELMVKFGGDGYVAWFGTIEIIAEELKITKGQDRSKVRALIKAMPRILAEQLMIPPDRLEKIYEFFRKKRKCKFSRTTDSWVVEIPKVLRYIDEYTEKKLKRSGHGRDKVGVEGEVEAEVEREQEGEVDHGTTTLSLELGKITEDWRALTGNSPFNGKASDAVAAYEAAIRAHGREAVWSLVKDLSDRHRSNKGRYPDTLQYHVKAIKNEAAYKAVGAAGWVPPEMRGGKQP